MKRVRSKNEIEKPPESKHGQTPRGFSLFKELFQALLNIIQTEYIGVVDRDVPQPSLPDRANINFFSKFLVQKILPNNFFNQSK